MPSVTAMTERVGCSVQGCKEQADALLTSRSIRQKWASPSEVQGVLRTNERRVAMRPGTQTRKATDETRSSVEKLRVSDEVRILIVSDDDSLTGQLKIAFREAGFIWETARTITAGCESASSGQFQVIITTPVLGDGSWRRLIDIANHYDLGFQVVLLARTFDLNQWAEALEAGAFDVLDALHELPKAAEVAKRALWAAQRPAPREDSRHWGTLRSSGQTRYSPERSPRDT